MDKTDIEIDEFHRGGPTCRRCKTRYVVHAMSEPFEVWFCYARLKDGRKCWTMNVWKPDALSVSSA